MPKSISGYLPLTKAGNITNGIDAAPATGLSLSIYKHGNGTVVCSASGVVQSIDGNFIRQSASLMEATSFRFATDLQPKSMTSKSIDNLIAECLPKLEARVKGYEGEPDMANFTCRVREN